MVAVTREVDEVEGRSARRWGRFDIDIVVAVTAAVVVLVPLAAVVSALRNPWIGLGDWVKLEQNVRDVGTGDTPLVGAWSRFGWDHPGPWPFYLMAPFYRLAGPEHGLLFATAMVNLLVVVAFVLVVLRYPRTKALVALVGLAVLLRGMGVGLLLDPWNPWMAILPFALFLLLAVEVAEGRRGWVGMGAAAAGSLAMQAHLGLLPPVGLIGATALVLHVRAVRARDGDRSWRELATGWIGAAGVLVVAWLPAVVDQLFGDGNLGKLARWASGDELVPPTQMDLGDIPNDQIPRAAAWLLDPIGLWAGRFQAPTWSFFQGFGEMGLWRLLLVAALLGTTVVLWRRHRDAPQARSALAAGWLALAGIVATVLALVTWRGAPFLWGVRWVTPIVMLVWISAGWAVAATATRRWPWLDAAGQQHDAGGGGAAGELQGVGGDGAAGELQGVGGDGAAGRELGVGGDGAVGELQGAGGGGRGGAVGREQVRNLAVLALAAVVVVAVPVGLALGKGSLGRVPGEVDAENWQVFGPRALEVLAHEPVIVIHTRPVVPSEDTAVLELYLDRKGIDWIDARDPDAAGHPSYFVMRIVAENGEIPMRPGVVAATDAPTIGPGGLLSQMVLVRQEPQDPEDVVQLPDL